MPRSIDDDLSAPVALPRRRCSSRLGPPQPAAAARPTARRAPSRSSCTPTSSARSAPSSRGRSATLQTKGVDGAKVDGAVQALPADRHSSGRAAGASGGAGGEGSRASSGRCTTCSSPTSARRQRADLLGYAKTLKLDMARFERDMDSDAVKKIIAADLAEGKKLGVAGTPTFTINGKEYSGTRTFDQLKALIARRGAARPSAPAKTAAAGAQPTAASRRASVDRPLLRLPVPVLRAVRASRSASCRRRASTALKLNVTFKHFPLSIHPAAQLAHQAALAAKEQGKFWEMHDLLFANPRTRAASRSDWLREAARSRPGAVREGHGQRRRQAGDRGRRGRGHQGRRERHAQLHHQRQDVFGHPAARAARRS